MSNTERPLSPHLSIYRWPITMTLSILHRITGVAMSLGLLVLAYWLVAVAAGGPVYAKAYALLNNIRFPQGSWLACQEYNTVLS